MTNGEVYDGVETIVLNEHIDSTVTLRYLVSNIVRCDNCKHLRVINDGKVYAVCEETDFEFMPCGTDTSKHFCAYGEKKEGGESNV